MTEGIMTEAGVAQGAGRAYELQAGEGLGRHGI
ncbi:hypothetical protein ABID19_002758 [Mesorhizobium robiniae]|uniref:Uncharacterized protein n=1 Tax=Mesorhizobium robiniae TaxID=559315 RepID=A0ABV2GNT6_9HYPH